MPRLPKKNAILLFALVVLGSGCGSVISEFDNLPWTELPEQTSWPLLVDMPAAPEARLTAGTADTAKLRLEQGLAESIQRKQRAEQTAIVFEDLTARAEIAETRISQSPPLIDESTMMAQASESRQRAAEPASFIELDALTAPVSQKRLRPLDTPVLSDNFEELARKALERAARSSNP